MGKVIPPIEIDERHLGPAMLALVPAMRAFVKAKLTAGLSNPEAARLAGYSASSKEYLSSIGYNLAHDPRVQAAIGEEANKLMRAEGPNSIRTLIKIRDDEKAENKDRIKCAVELLNRSGFHAITENITHVEHHLSDAQKDARILELARELGLGKEEATKLLIAPAQSKNIIDAAYEEIIEPAPMTEEQLKAKQAQERDNALRRQRRKMSPDELAAHKAKTLAERSAKAKEEYQNQQQQFDGASADPDPYAGLPDDLSDIL